MGQVARRESSWQSVYGVADQGSRLEYGRTIGGQQQRRCETPSWMPMALRKERGEGHDFEPKARRRRLPQKLWILLHIQCRIQWTRRSVIMSPSLSCVTLKVDAYCMRSLILSGLCFQRQKFGNPSRSRAPRAIKSQSKYCSLRLSDKGD